MPDTPPHLTTVARNPRREAQALLGTNLDARVLEPSPPAIVDDWFADDPTDTTDSQGTTVGPTGAADLTWLDWLQTSPEHETWASDRWLGAYRRLEGPPATLTETRLALHRLAIYVISPARRLATGKIALRWTLGGFGTPFFADDIQVRLVGNHLVRQHGDHAQSRPVTTLSDAATFVLDGPPDLEWAAAFDVPPAGDLDGPLGIDTGASRWLGDWFGFAYSVLEELRADVESVETSRVQLWVEHFDVAFECLPEETGRRAGYGVSPGDAGHPEPYLYVAPWDADRVPSSSLWNATSFRGAVLPLRELLGAPDQRAAALMWLRERRALLAS